MKMGNKIFSTTMSVHLVVMYQIVFNSMIKYAQRCHSRGIRKISNSWSVSRNFHYKFYER